MQPMEPNKPLRHAQSVKTLIIKKYIIFNTNNCLLLLFLIYVQSVTFVFSWVTHTTLKIEGPKSKAYQSQKVGLYLNCVCIPS